MPLTGKQEMRNAEITQNKLIYARAATYNTNQNVHVCVCCNIDVHKDICKTYNKVDYDFSSFVVSQYLGHVANSANEEQYICVLCGKRLKETSNENPLLPYYGRYPHAVAGADFLKALNQRPECVHMLSSYVVSKNCAAVSH